jgi:hypothetical protein
LVYLANRQKSVDTFAEVHRDTPGQQRRRTMESSLAYSIAEACTRSGIGRTAIYDMINSGKLMPLPDAQ